MSVLSCLGKKNHQQRHQGVTAKAQQNISASQVAICTIEPAIVPIRQELCGPCADAGFISLARFWESLICTHVSYMQRRELSVLAAIAIAAARAGRAGANEAYCGQPCECRTISTLARFQPRRVERSGRISLLAFGLKGEWENCLGQLDTAKAEPVVRASPFSSGSLGHDRVCIARSLLGRDSDKLTSDRRATVATFRRLRR